MSDLIPHGFPDKETPITVVDMSITYYNNGDETLTIKTNDQGAELYFSMETKTWSFTFDELEQVLNDFKKRFTEHESKS